MRFIPQANAGGLSLSFLFHTMETITDNQNGSAILTIQSKIKVEKPTRKSNLSKGNEPFSKLIRDRRRGKKLLNRKIENEKEKATQHIKYLEDIKSILDEQSAEPVKWQKALKECNTKIFRRNKKLLPSLKKVSITKKKSKTDSTSPNTGLLKRIKTEFEIEKKADEEMESFHEREEEEGEEEEEEIKKAMRILDTKVTKTAEVLNLTGKEVEKIKQYSEGFTVELTKLENSVRAFVDETLQEVNSVTAEIRTDNALRHREKSADQFAGSAAKKIKTQHVQQLLASQSSGKQVKKRTKTVSRETEELPDDHIKPTSLACGTNLFRIYKYHTEVHLDEIFNKSKNKGG